MNLMPSMTPDLLRRLNAVHMYAVNEVAAAEPAELARLAGLDARTAGRLKDEAGEVLVLLRRRSELRKFVRAHVPPRRGRSHAKIMRALFARGIDTIEQLAGISTEALTATGIGEKEAASLLSAASALCSDRRLRAIGIPPISLKKYYAAGLTRPEDFVELPPAAIVLRTGISPDTVHRHVELVCTALGRPVPPRTTRGQIERGRAQLLAIPGVGESTIEKLYSGGVFDAESLARADPKAVAEGSGLPVRKIQDLQASVAEPRQATG
jgi:DNA topoisomerase-1